jgi:hypothetical protein
VNRPLARVEDLARDLMRSLRPELAARALLLSKAPSDVVTANQTYVTDGQRLIPLAGIWRDERFPDAVEQAKLQALSDAIDEVTGLNGADYEAVACSIEPRGVPAASSTPSNERFCGSSSAPTSIGHRPGCPRCTATPTRQSSTPCTSPGRAQPHRDSPTTTGYKVPGC